MKYTYTKVPKTNWIRYILNISGWEGAFGEFFSEVHVTMPKTIGPQMANWPHITVTAKDGWVFHRYENSKRKYLSKNRLVKKGVTPYPSDTYSETSNETLIVQYISDDLATMSRP